MSAYQAERTIEAVLAGIPPFVREVIVVVDGCTEGTGTAVDRAAARNGRIDHGPIVASVDTIRNLEHAAPLQIMGLPELTAEDKTAILGGNAAGLFGF